MRGGGKSSDDSIFLKEKRRIRKGNEQIGRQSEMEIY